ncbi:CD209 antigen-like protein B isoform c [Mus musculus]|uniref:Isoform 3 of CD209 antigen-like protein B n=1 Tax=Mus musculus TaxID=10090 RepID=Q8CJ91-3|nr:CD209 antigen-like protein B isoform c [Mus musculus]|eukprot:NP_001274140.1 CD209 antigen-like protein B isoform c [Mus musculus]
MSDSTEAKMQPLSSMDDDELMVSGSRYSIKSSRLRPNSGIKCLAVSKTPNTERQKEQEKILQELTQLTDELTSRIPISQGKNESMQAKITEQLMQLKTELLSRIPIFQGQNESIQEKISEQLMQLKAELLSKISSFPVKDDSKQEKIYQQLVQMKTELFRLCRLCPWDWTFLLGNCYFFSKSQRNWNDAVTACKEVKAQLVIINSDEEQTFLQQTSKAKGPTWMGLSDLKKEATWLWVDGSTLSSSRPRHAPISRGRPIYNMHSGRRFQKYWNRGEPNNIGEEDCVEFAGDGWNDSKCELKKFWICKKSATPCTEG